MVNVHLNDCDKTSSNGFTVNIQTSNSDSTSDGMVNLSPPPMTMHLEMVQDQTLSEAAVITHRSESNSIALPGCSERNSVTFSAILSLESASMTLTSTITGQGIAYSETFYAKEPPQH